jgi:glycine cleavage system H protein
MSEDIVVEIGKKKYIVKKDRRYTETDEWALKRDDGKIVVGITDYAQKQLRDIVGVELPDVDTEVSKGDSLGVVESIKATSDYYAPVSGKVVEVNETLLEQPELINDDPYGKGWIVVIDPSKPEEYEELLTPEQYADKIRKEKH